MNAKGTHYCRCFSPHHENGWMNETGMKFWVWKNLIWGRRPGGLMKKKSLQNTFKAHATE